jgi:hypothetical protein
VETMMSMMGESKATISVVAYMIEHCEELL